LSSTSTNSASTTSSLPPLRAPAGLDAPDTRNAVKIPPLSEPLVARAPNFAQAWASLSGYYINTLVLAPYGGLLLRPVEESRRQMSLAYEKTEKAAREAIRLDATQADTYRALAELEAVRSHWAAAEDLFRRGLELDPNNTILLQWYGFFSLRTGRLRQALPMMQEALALEPLVPATNDWLALAHIHHHGVAAFHFLRRIRRMNLRDVTFRVRNELFKTV
jgi:tetratricopeptide (TPR) repeat protein